jgi:hypothetical protein
MSLLSSVNEAARNSPYFSAPLPAGVASNLTWTANAYSPLYEASISNVSPFLTNTSPLSCTLQCGQANLSDAYNYWLISAVPSTLSGGSIKFVVAGNPATPSSFPISWAVAKF